MNYLKVSPKEISQKKPSSQNEPLSLFCDNFEEAKEVIDIQETYIVSLHKEIVNLRKELRKEQRYVITNDS